MECLSSGKINKIVREMAERVMGDRIWHVGGFV